MSKQTVPTLEEFKELVKKEYLDLEWVVGEENAMRYFNSEEAQDHIKTSYDEAVKDYNDGELGVEGFQVGEASKVAYNLYMMYE